MRELYYKIRRTLSGIKMLWSGLWLTSVLMCLRPVVWWIAALVYGLSVVIVVFLNGVRAAALFYQEIIISYLPDWLHAGIGIACFLLYCIMANGIISTWSYRKHTTSFSYSW